MIISLLEDLEHRSLIRGIPIVGREKGSWLYSKVQELQPQRILELGTANGYSGIILGSEGAELVTIEINADVAEEAKKNFEQFSIQAWVVVGDAIKKVRALAQDNKNKGSFDLIFIDFAKQGYIKVLEDCITLVRTGGLIIADNITFEGCQDFRKAVLKHPRLRTEIIAIKDGLSCSEKINFAPRA